MRILILIACLLTFTATGFADTAQAGEPDHMCTYHQLDQNNHMSDKPCHSDQEQGQCDDCCGMHSHSVATIITPEKSVFSSHKQTIITATSQHYSTDPSSLKRPPRL